MQKENQRKLNVLLNEIEDTLWDDEFVNPGVQVEYTDKTLVSACKIFAHVLLSKMWDYQEEKNIAQSERENCALETGKAIHDIALKYTGMDLHKIYDKEGKNENNS